MRRIAFLALVFLLAGCGFQLRGSYTLPWQTLHLGLPATSEMYAQLKRNIEVATPTRVVSTPQQAEATLAVLRNDQAKNILSLSATGLVREFQLVRTFAYRLQDAGGKEIAPPVQIILQREMTFDDAHIFAKEAEEAMLWREMQADLVQQLLRRLSSTKPVPSVPATPSPATH